MRVAVEVRKVLQSSTLTQALLNAQMSGWAELRLRGKWRHLDIGSFESLTSQRYACPLSAHETIAEEESQCLRLCWSRKVRKACDVLSLWIAIESFESNRKASLTLESSVSDIMLVGAHRSCRLVIKWMCFRMPMDATLRGFAEQIFYHSFDVWTNTESWELSVDICERFGARLTLIHYTSLCRVLHAVLSPALLFSLFIISELTVGGFSGVKRDKPLSPWPRVGRRVAMMCWDRSSVWMLKDSLASLSMIYLNYLLMQTFSH